MIAARFLHLLRVVFVFMIVTASTLSGKDLMSFEGIVESVEFIPQEDRISPMLTFVIVIRDIVGDEKFAKSDRLILYSTGIYRAFRRTAEEVGNDKYKFLAEEVHVGDDKTKSIFLLLNATVVEK